jgi:hypothetical protein
MNPESQTGIKPCRGLLVHLKDLVAYIKNTGKLVRCQCLMSVILATQEAEYRRIVVQDQPGQIVHKPLPQKYPTQKRTGRAPS